MRERLADLYAASHATSPGWEHRGRQDFLRRLARDIRHPGFAMLVANTSALAGCAYGFPVGCDGSWWQGFRGTLPHSIEQLTASGRVFAITEIVVHPRERHRDLAGCLQKGLLAYHQASLGAILVDRVDGSSLAAFRASGWQEIGEVRRSPGATVLRALVLPLEERTATESDGPAHHPRTRRPE